MEWGPGDWMSRQRCAGRLGGKAEFVWGLTGGGWAEALCCRLGGSGVLVLGLEVLDGEFCCVGVVLRKYRRNEYLNVGNLVAFDI